MRRWKARWLGLWAVLTAPVLFGGACVVNAYRGLRGEFGDIFIDVGRYDDDRCCGWHDDDDFEDAVEDFFDDVLDWD